MLFAWPLIGRRPRGRDLAGLTLCVAGIAALFGSGGAIGIENLPGVSFALAAALLFALGTILLKPIALPPFAAVAWQLVIGCTPMIVLGMLFEHPRVDALSPLGVGLMAYMTGRADGRLLPDVVRSAASAARRNWVRRNPFDADHRRIGGRDRTGRAVRGKGVVCARPDGRRTGAGAAETLSDRLTASRSPRLDLGDRR